MDKQRRYEFFCENPKFALFWQMFNFRPKSQPILLKLGQGFTYETNQWSANYKLVFAISSQASRTPGKYFFTTVNSSIGT